MRYALAVVISLSSITAYADAAYHVNTDTSVVSYFIHVPGSLEKATGPSKKVEGTAHFDASGALTAQLRAPIDSFDSGNGKRDTKMRTFTDSAHYPFVEVKVHGDSVAAPSTFPTTITRTLKADVSFHGITQTLDVPTAIRFEAANKITAKATFTLSLGAFKVERPKVLFWQVADDVKIQADLTFVR